MDDPATRRLLKETKFPAEYDTKVDIKKVNKDVMKSWIASRLTEILETHDDVVIETCIGMLFDPVKTGSQPNIKRIHLTMTGFLEKETEPFCKELWKHCISAQDNPTGVSQEMLDSKKVELLQQQADAARREEEARKTRETRNLESRDRRGGHRDGGRFDRRDRDRGDRNRGDRSSFRGHGSYRGGRGSHRDDRHDDQRRRNPSRSRSPPRRRYRSRSRSRSPRRHRSRSPEPRRRRRSSPSPQRPRRRYESRSPPRRFTKVQSQQTSGRQDPEIPRGPRGYTSSHGDLKTRLKSEDSSPERIRGTDSDHGESVHFKREPRSRSPMRSHSATYHKSILVNRESQHSPSQPCPNRDLIKGEKTGILKRENVELESYPKFTGAVEKPAAEHEKKVNENTEDHTRYD